MRMKKKRERVVAFSRVLMFEKLLVVIHEFDCDSGEKQHHLRCAFLPLPLCLPSLSCARVSCSSYSTVTPAPEPQMTLWKNSSHIDNTDDEEEGSVGFCS